MIRTFSVLLPELAASYFAVYVSFCACWARFWKSWISLAVLPLVTSFILLRVDPALHPAVAKSANAASPAIYLFMKSEGTDFSAKAKEPLSGSSAGHTGAVERPRLVEDQRALEEVVAAVAALPASAGYALDTEFHRERTYWPRLALIQLAWPGGVVLIDPLTVDPAPLGELLAGPGCMVAHAADQDLAILERACGRLPTRLFDTHAAAGL